jgi:hypothetical protein
MNIQLLYFDGCPNWRVADERLAAALHELGREAPVTRVQVEDWDAAERLNFTGSPTVLIDGRDPFTTGAPVAMACRVYRTEDGLDGSPSVAQLKKAMA